MQQLQSDARSRQEIYEPVRWKERDAVRLTNGIVELIALTRGGHLASFRFLNIGYGSAQNVLWEPPWTTCEPSANWSDEMSRLYGPPETGKFLASFAGHALCLDYFGDPPDAMRAQGLGIHGEAATVEWITAGCATPGGAQCCWTARLPVSQLAFERKIHLGTKENVGYVEETATNEGDTQHECDWVEHVTLGPPFLTQGASTILVSAQAGMTSPHGYEGKSLLLDNSFFSWPYVRSRSADDVIDLRHPFAEKGRGFLAGMELDPSRQIEFLLVVNWELRLGVGYCFRRRDFPWMAVWEENCARIGAPWNGATRARGMEFGTKPLPLPTLEKFHGKTFCNAPTRCIIPAHGTRAARYLMFLFTVPCAVGSTECITDVLLTGNSVRVIGRTGNTLFSLQAEGCETFLVER